MTLGATAKTRVQWRSLLLMCCCCCHLAKGGLPPDGTGLVGTAPAPDKPLLPLKFWANSPKSPLKPRRKDLHDTTLLKLMEPDYDPRWMRRTHHNTMPHVPMESEDRQTVAALRDLMSEHDLPADLPPEYRALVKNWMVKTATCPIKYVWEDLGKYFWPRWIRKGECDNQRHRGNTGISLGGNRRNSSASDRDVRYSLLAPAPSCSWPPGMMCVPGVARNLLILRWHCRLRKNSNNNNVWSPDRMRKVQERRKKRRKYRCQWLKVPYPVSEDCICSC